MDCLCILDNIFSFSITFRKDYWLLTDYSKWDLDILGQNINVKIPLDIKVDNKIISTFIYPGQVNKMSYDDLPDTECGKDGLYEFTLTACSETQVLSVYYPIINNIHCAYTNLILDEDWDNANELKRYIEFINANTYYEDFNTAKDYISISMKFIKKLKCNC